MITNRKVNFCYESFNSVLSLSVDASLDSVRQVFIKHPSAVDINPAKRCIRKRNSTGTVSQLYILMATSVNTSRHHKSTIKN